MKSISSLYYSNIWHRFHLFDCNFYFAKRFVCFAEANASVRRGTRTTSSRSARHPITVRVNLYSCISPFVCNPPLRLYSLWKPYSIISYCIYSYAKTTNRRCQKEIKNHCHKKLFTLKSLWNSFEYGHNFPLIIQVPKNKTVADRVAE